MLIDINGQSVYLYDGGEQHQKNAPVICFIHGAAMDHTVWTLFSRYWAKQGFNVVAVDLPGHGQSTGEPFKTIDDSAEFMCALMQQCLPGNKVHWVGHSMGSLIALECAQRYAQTVGLIMMGTAFPMRVGKPLLDAAKANDHQAIDIVSLVGHSFGSQLGGNPIAGIYIQQFAERLMEQADDGVMYTDLNACHNYKSGVDTAEKVSCPVGLILAELDHMTPPKATNTLCEAMPHATVINIADCGHMMMTEKPEKTHLALHQCIAEKT